MLAHIWLWIYDLKKIQKKTEKLHINLYLLSESEFECSHLQNVRQNLLGFRLRKFA